MQGLAANATGAWALVSTTGGIGTISGCYPGNCLIRIDPAGVVQWTRKVDATGQLEADGDAVWLSTGAAFVRHDDLGATEWALPVSSVQIAPGGDLLTLENLAIPNADHVVNRRSKADPTVVLSSFVATPRKEVTLLQHRVDSKGRIAIVGTVFPTTPWLTPDVGGFGLPQPDGNGAYSGPDGFITVFEADGTKVHRYRLHSYEYMSTAPVVRPE